MRSKERSKKELYDVLYYVIALANVYDIDLEECVAHKENLNNLKNRIDQ